MSFRSHQEFCPITKAVYFAVVWSIHWEVEECVRLESGTHLIEAMSAFVERCEAAGWKPEGNGAWGFFFVNFHGERRLAMITERDPYSTSHQSFTPFRSAPQ
jgi:hypothetical protein